MFYFADYVCDRFTISGSIPKQTEGIYYRTKSIQHGRPVYRHSQNQNEAKLWRVDDSSSDAGCTHWVVQANTGRVILQSFHTSPTPIHLEPIWYIKDVQHYDLVKDFVIKCTGKRIYGSSNLIPNRITYTHSKVILGLLW